MKAIFQKLKIYSNINKPLVNTQEDLVRMIVPMAKDGKDPVGAMGADAPLAILSDKPQLLYSYFKQMFAQVTNPPIDSIREEMVTSTRVMLGNSGNLTDPNKAGTYALSMRTPILTNQELASIKALDCRRMKSVTLPILFDPSKGAEGLRDALTACGVEWEELPGEGAFYGPKIEYHVKDALGRSWQCGTLQLDFVLPERLNAEYVTENNDRARPVMLHRAILGSLERFIGILIENHAGSFPLWLAPVQMVIMNITENQADYCREVAAKLQAAGFRVELDLRNEKIGYKIRDNSQYRFPYQIVVGDKEKQENKVAVRRKAEDLGSLNVDDFIAQLQQEITDALVNH